MLWRCCSDPQPTDCLFPTVNKGLRQGDVHQPSMWRGLCPAWQLGWPGSIILGSISSHSPNPPDRERQAAWPAARLVYFCSVRRILLVSGESGRGFKPQTKPTNSITSKMDSVTNYIQLPVFFLALIVIFSQRLSQIRVILLFDGLCPPNRALEQGSGGSH